MQKKLGAGCFGEVYSAVNRETHEVMAVKIEDWTAGYSQLEHEAEVLRNLVRPVGQQGFANIQHLGKEGKHVFLVMDLLGRSLEDRMQQCKKFKFRSAVLVAEQVLSRIEYLHSKCIIHRDIKPENFVFGSGGREHILYLIDFGLSKKYWDKTHVAMRRGMALTGTARYVSINAHKGFEQSRRDDLEAIGHMFLYCLRGSLPWSGLDANSKEEKYRKIREKKEQTPLPELCHGYPTAFEVFLTYTRQLGFKERPDYNRLRKLFVDLRKELSCIEGRVLEDWSFEWNDGRELPVNFVPLDRPANGFTQPDDSQHQAPRDDARGGLEAAGPQEGGRRRWCCFCSRKRGDG